MKDCAGCSLVAEAALGKSPQLIYEFANSFLFLGDHQYFEGYSVLMFKRHVRELHEMSPTEYAELMDELMRSTRAIQAAFDPWKMNHASLGNQLGHVHWHIMPRYESDPDHLLDPWHNADQFKTRVPSPATRDELIRLIRGRIS
jgi:diadenosine tetraphosphate (Ap4A) HIT family hydrolase